MPVCRPSHALPLLAVLLGPAGLQAQNARLKEVPEAQAAAAGMLAPVVVTGTRTERTQEDAPVRTEVVSREEIDRMHARTLTEALANVPGVLLRPVTGKAGYEVSMQGLSSEQVLVLVDGLPVTASTGSTVDLSQIALAGVERIEIVKGALSAQYGSSAMGGVINVITRAPSQGFSAELGGDVGSYGEQNPSGNASDAASKHLYARLNTGNDTVRLGLSVDARNSDGFDPTPDTWPQPGDAVDRRQMDARLDWQPSVDQKFMLGYGYFTENAESRFSTTLPGNTLNQSKDEEVTRHRFTGGYTRSFDSGLKFQLNGVSETFNDDTLKTNQATGARFDDRRADLDMQHINLQTDLPVLDLLVDQLWQIGADYRYESLVQTKDGASEMDRPKAERDSSELFVQGDIFVTPTWELLPGLRVQDDSDFGEHSAFKLNAKGTLIESEALTAQVRFGWGQGYRVPNLKERFYRFDHSSIGYMVVGNPDLTPEASSSWQAGMQVRWQTASAGVVDVDANVFLNRIKDMIQIDEDNPGTGAGGIAIYTYKNVERARTQGLEIGLGWRPTEVLRLTANWTWMQTEDEATGAEITRQPEHQARIGADWRLSAIALPQTELSLRGRHTGSELVSTSTGARSPAWTQWDMSINHDLTRAWRVFAGVDNLANRQRDFSDPYDFSPMQGRFVYMGSRYRF